MYLRLSAIRRGSRKPISDFAQLDPAGSLPGAITVAAALREPLGIIPPAQHLSALDFQISRSHYQPESPTLVLQPRIFAACG